MYFGLKSPPDTEQMFARLAIVLEESRRPVKVEQDGRDLSSGVDRRCGNLRRVADGERFRARSPLGAARARALWGVPIGSASVEGGDCCIDLVDGVVVVR